MIKGTVDHHSGNCDYILHVIKDYPRESLNIIWNRYQQHLKELSLSSAQN